jgi:predicted Zn-dependent protease
LTTTIPIPRRPRRLNPRGLALLTALAAGLGLGGWALVENTGAAGPLLLDYARTLREAGREDLALGYLLAYLDRHPRDLDAVMMAGALLSDRAGSIGDLESAIALYERALRLATNAASARAQEARRRLVGLYLKVGPYQNWMLTKYRTADLLAEQLLTIGGRTPESLRLRGRVKLQLARVGDPRALQDGVALFEEARRLEPGNVGGALALATTYRELRREFRDGLEVMDELARANPSVEAGLARLRFLQESAQVRRDRADWRQAREIEAEAEAQLRRLVEAWPSDPDVRFAQCEHAMAVGRTEEAHAALESVPEVARRGGRYLAVAGLLRLREGHVDEAIATWRAGLMESGGADAELTWWLAYAELERGRTAEAEPLIDQYRRLVGGEEPDVGWRFLDGVRALARNRPKDAIRALGLALSEATPELRSPIHLALARAHRILRDPAQALVHYRQAMEEDPNSTTARLGYFEVLRSLRPDQAREALEAGMERAADDPVLLDALAGAELERQRALPRARRDWSTLAALAERARRAAPDHPATIELQARLELETGREAEAVARLEAALGPRPHSGPLWLIYAEALVRAGALDEAVAALDHARGPEAVGDEAVLRIAQGRLLDALGRPGEARDALVADLDRLGPEERASCWLALGDFELARRRRDDALRAYRQGVALGPDDPQSRLVVLDLALGLPPGDPDADDLVRESVEALERIEGPHGAGFLLGQAMVLLDQAADAPVEGRGPMLDRAADLLARARDVLLDDRYSDVLEGRLMELRDRPEDAAAAYERALARQGGDEIEGRLAALYARLGKADELARLRRERSEAEPSLDRFAAEASSRRGLPDRAEALARRVVEGRPDDPDARLWQAQLLNSLGKAEQAEATLRQLVERHPERLGPRLAQLGFYAAVGDAAKAEATVEKIIGEVRGLERPELVYAQCWRVAGRLERADAAIDEALGRWPDDSRVVRGASDHFERTGRPERAEAVLRRALDAHPGWRWAALDLAALLSARPNDLASWREAWSLVAPEAGGADTPEQIFARALVLSRSPNPGQPREAQALLRRLLTALPADLPASARARMLLARLCLRDGRAEEAASLIERDARAPADHEAIALRVEALLACDRRDEASALLDRVDHSAIGRGAPAVALLRARVQGAGGRADEAVATLRDARGAMLDRPDGEALGREAVRVLLGLDRPDAALEMAEALGRRWPSARLVAATVEAERGHHAEALRRYREAVAGADAEGLREIARNLIALAVASRLRPEILAGADAALAEARALRPEDDRLLVRQAHLRHLQGRYREEVRLYCEALALAPSDRGFLNNLAWTLCEELRRPDEALGWIEEAFRVAPVSPRLLDTRGVIYTRLGRLAEAIGDLEAATKGARSPTMLAHLARAYHLHGEPEKFRLARDEALRAGLTLDRLEPGERAELGRLLGLPGRAGPDS